MNEGLKFLAIQAQKQGIKLKELSKVLIIPFHGFIDELITLMRRYTSKPISQSWGQYIALCSSDKQFSNLYSKIVDKVGSWLKYNLTSLQAKLISTLLITDSVSKLTTFLKLRKLILKTDFSTKTLDSLSLQHSDIIGIIHAAYSMPEVRKKLLDGVKSLFISFRMQQARIQSTVFIEYALSFHNQIRQKQMAQATIGQQKNNYGSIPQSILMFSSIKQKNIDKNKQSQNASKNQTSNNNNTSQYISNFHSIIHDENGLHRKIKSSQISLQGFKIIDHKFHDNVIDSNNNKSMKNQNKSPIAALNSRKYGDQKPNKKHFTQNDEKFQSKTPIKIQKTISFGITQAQNDSKRQINRQSSIRDSKNEQIIISSKKNQNFMFSDNKQSMSYSQKFQSPDISYELTPGAYSHLKQAQTNKKKNIKSNQKSQVDKNKKDLKIEFDQIQKQDEQSIKEKQGGYQMWKRLKDRNHQFIAKMLKTHQLSRIRNQGQKMDDESSPQQINIIHDSIVRHFGVDKRSQQTQKSKIVQTIKNSTLK